MNFPAVNIASPIKILIADDNDSDRLILKSIVKKQGHVVFTAADGVEAVEAFKTHRPQLVLLDALMPRMNGLEAARLIRKAAGEEFVPILFLTSLQDANALADCLDAGGDDFLTKPYNQVILQAKINAFNRMRSMHKMVQSQRDQIVIHNEHLLQEQEVAKTVFDNVAHAGCLDVPNIKYLLSPLAVFNGDVLLASMRPSGGMHILLGDFTGHGLPAAIGAMPLAEIFYGMTAKGFTIADILCEVNLKLKSILPVGVFCCACMLDMNFEKQMVKVWVGGVPDCHMYHSRTNEYTVIESQHLPLGVLDASAFKTDMYVLEMPVGDRLIICSDGIQEALNCYGEMFGNDRLVEQFEQCNYAELLFENINTSVNQFMGESERDDDITLIEVTMVHDHEFDDINVGLASAGINGPMDWSLQYELRPQTLREFNPLPLLLHIIVEVPGLRPFSGQIYTILAELYSNALEHGVMGLKSALKATPAGFMEYYEARTAKLETLGDGYVRIKFDHCPLNNGGRLTINIEDSGEGFDYESKLDCAKGNGDYCGRGIALIGSLCETINYHGRGNIVEASYLWQYE